MKSKLLIATAISSMIAFPAMAQDTEPFTGLYGGVEAGVDWTKLAGDLKRDRSLYYGGVIGFRQQMDGGLVMGIEGTFGKSGYENNAVGIDADYEWSTSLVLGSTFGDGGNLLYAKAGYAQTSFDPQGTQNDSFTDGGWRFGGGYERAINEHLSFRLGGDYTTYGNDNGQWQAKGGLLLKF